MEATRSPYREVHHAAPEPGGYEFINPGGWRTSALMRIPDSRRTLREVRKGQQETLLLLLVCPQAGNEDPRHLIARERQPF
jgi:hypothetical protein